MSNHTEGNEPIKRYDIALNNHKGIHYVDCSEDPIGDWVKYEDVQALTNINVEMLAALKEIVKTFEYRKAHRGHTGVGRKYLDDFKKLISIAEGNPSPAEGNEE